MKKLKLYFEYLGWLYHLWYHGGMRLREWDRFEDIKKQLGVK